MKKIKVLSLILVLLLVSSFIFAACDNKPVDPTETQTETQKPTETQTETTKPTETQTEEPPKGVEKPDRLDITCLYYFGDTTENLDMKKEFKDYVTDKYGIDFRFHSPARDTYIETINLQLVSKDLVGVVSLFTGFDMIAWAQEGVIYALDEYLADNETWINIIPESWKEIYTWNGQIWGIPRGDDGHPSWFIRTMRGDWLDNLGLKKPETIDAFYEVSKAFTLNDPDGNGENDTWGFCSRTMWLMQDMFHAHDARTNHVGALIPLWNPNRNIWEDSVIKPEMAEAATFLRKCYTEGLVHPEVFTMSAADVRALMSDGHAGSCYYWDTWLIAWEDAVKTHTPTGYMVGIGAIGSKNISTKINPCGIGIGAPNVMTIYTEQPKEVINWYVNLLYGEPESYYTFRYGIPQDNKDAGNGVFIDGQTVYLLFHQLDKATNTVSNLGTPEVVTGHPDYALDIGSFGFKTAYNSGDPIWDVTRAVTTAKNLERRYDVMNEYDDGRLFLPQESLQEPDNEEFTTVKSEWAAAGRKYVTDVMIEGISTEAALKAYLDTIMSFDPQFTLDLLNERLGKTSEQDYNALWSSMN